jgi:acyl carrier protein
MRSLMNDFGHQNPISADAIRAWLVTRVAKELGLPEARIKTDEEFANLGLGSRQAILITGELEDLLRREELDPSLLWDFPTIDKLAAHLATLGPEH